MLVQNLQWGWYGQLGMVWPIVLEMLHHFEKDPDTSGLPNKNMLLRHPNKKFFTNQIKLTHTHQTPCTREKAKTKL